jgi:hypothetical protein
MLVFGAGQKLRNAGKLRGFSGSFLSVFAQDGVLYKATEHWRE